ncbi:MAG: NusG domain II-containing protein [Lachnospiraceae bacterium]|nr:NusG domain II-containing protein [Lachnospiraceae bacterium]
MSNVKLFKKTDLIIVFILVLIAAAGFFAFRIFNSGEGSIVRITVDGTVYAEADLNTDADFDIPGIKGICRLKIKDGTADMIFAECPNQICVNHSSISGKGESIVCLPNRVIVEIR